MLTFCFKLHWIGAGFAHGTTLCQGDRAGCRRIALPEGEAKVVGLGPFPSWIAISPPSRLESCLQSPSPGATVSHVCCLVKSSEISHCWGNPHRTTPENGEEKRASGKRPFLFKTEQTSLTKCYFGMNTRCRFTSVRGTVEAAALVPPHQVTAMLTHVRGCACVGPIGECLST